MKLSHGIIKGIINENLIKFISRKCNSYISKQTKYDNYYEISNSSIGAEELINKELMMQIRSLLNHNSPRIEAIELHIQEINCKAIPFHQDNFYHCLKNPEEGLKVLIPLNKLNKKNGALSFSNCRINSPLLSHSPSEIRNFSSYIKSEIIQKNNLNFTSYDYEVGDVSYHYLNSIHFSYGNSTSRKSIFLVFRFQVPGAKVDKESLKRYQDCYQKHSSQLKKI